MNLHHKHILITGANGGIGRAFAFSCARLHSHLYLVMRRPDLALEEDLKKNGASSVQTFLADLSAPQAVSELCHKLEALPIDVVFNNAGLLTGGLLEDQPWSDIENMLQVNVHALIRLTRTLIPGMVKRGQGKIINNSSVSGIMYFPCASTYAASKAAVVGFTQCLEVELLGTGVSTLLLITPGIKTRMYDQIKPLYGKNLDVPDDYISPEVYAERILGAIREDRPLLQPPLLSMTGLGLRIAKYLNGLFKWAVRNKFHRN